MNILLICGIYSKIVICFTEFVFITNMFLNDEDKRKVAMIYSILAIPIVAYILFK